MAVDQKYEHGPHPVVEGAPGLMWRQRTQGRWTVLWHARTDLIGQGFKPKSIRLWTGTEPNEIERSWIVDQSNRLQNEMLLFSRGGKEIVAPFSGTIRSLIDCYQTDPDSRYRKLRYATRLNHDRLLKRIADERGDVPLSDIKARVLLRWHEGWVGAGQNRPLKISMSHALVGQIRTSTATIR